MVFVVVDISYAYTYAGGYYRNGKCITQKSHHNCRFKFAFTFENRQKKKLENLKFRDVEDEKQKQQMTA